MTNDQHRHDDVEEHDLGLTHDLGRLTEQRAALGRRGLLGILGGLGAVAVVGCASDGGSAAGTSGSTAASTSTAATSAATPSASAPTDGGGQDAPASEIDVATGEIPEETAGPYPGDGTNGPDVLSESGVVRRDLTRSFGTATGVAEGVPVTVRLTVYDLAGESASALAGAAVYLWHCDREGRYSLYDEGVVDENFLRGVGEADADGLVEFTTIFPACYAGRWPHMHLEVYPSLGEATSADNKLRTTQLAIPAATCEEVYGVVDGYESSVSTFSAVGLDSDMVFSDGYSLQLAKVSGSVSDGFTLALNVPV